MKSFFTLFGLVTSLAGLAQQPSPEPTSSMSSDTRASIAIMQRDLGIHKSTLDALVAKFQAEQSTFEDLKSRYQKLILEANKTCPPGKVIDESNLKACVIPQPPQQPTPQK